MLFLARYNTAKYYVLADQVVVSGSAFATNLLLARCLGLSEYGKFSGIVLLQLFLLSLQQAGISGVYQVLFPRYNNATQKNYTNGIFYMQLFIYLLLITIACALYFLFPQLISVYKSVLTAAALSTILYLLQDGLRKMLLTQQQESKAFLIDVITNAAQLIILALAAFLQKLTLISACWIIALTFIPSIFAGIIWLKPGGLSKRSVAIAAKRHKQQSSWMLLSALLQWFAGNFFIIAAGWWLGAAVLGALRLTQYIFGLINVLLQAIENYALPKASAIQNSNEQLSVYLKTILKKLFLFISPVLLLLALFAKPLLFISGGAAYTNYVYVVYALSIIYLLIVIGYPVRIALRVQLQNQAYFIGYALATAFSLITAKLFIQQWQLKGVLAGLFISQFIIISYWLFVLQRKKLFVWKSFISY